MSGKTKIRLYNAIRAYAVRFTPWFAITVRMARYGPPVHGSSTSATKIPSRIAAGAVRSSIRSAIFVAYYSGIIRDDPFPYQKKSLISRTPPSTTIPATVTVT